MRLWHYKLIPYLPKQQLVAQWRELNSIFANQPHHILINYVYEDEFTSQDNLLVYSYLVIQEMRKRNIKIKSFDKYNNYFNGLSFYTNIKEYVPFRGYHNDEYLKICCWNLYEKYIRGQNGFNEENIAFIKKWGGIK